ncbi:lantibiotic dehydratase [Arthrobacter sp. G119Y2]|uniref:lantibiotic dehydratase n=1 Tax=Arthrobacter sp. G119Y2 TaxID=3134965 RepID=UPI00311A7A58
MTALSELNDPSARKDYEGYWSALGNLRRGRSEISDSVFSLIAARRGGGQDTKQLVALRRSLYKLDAAAVAAHLSALSDDDRNDVAGVWGAAANDVGVWLAFESVLSNSFEDLLGSQRARLVRLAEEPEFQRGLAVSAPDLFEAAERYGRGVHAGDVVDKRGKRAERSMIAYLLRAAAKTTPFSTLGAVAFPGSNAAKISRTRSRWNVYPLARVLSAVANDHSLMRGFIVRLSPYTREAEGVRTVDRAVWTFKDVETRDDYAACVESDVELRSDAVMKLVAELLGAGEATWGELVDDVVKAGALSRERAGDLVAGLARLGAIVTPAREIDAFDSAGFDHALGQLASGSEQGSRLADELHRYRSLAASLAGQTDPRARAALVRSLRSLVEETYAAAGIDAPAPRSVVYEDLIVPATDPGLVDKMLLSSYGAGDLVSFIDLLDTLHSKRALLNGYFLHMVEAGKPVDNVAEVLRGFHTELLNSYEAYAVDRVPTADLSEDPWLRWGGAWRWEESRRGLIEDLRSLQHSTTLDAADLTQILAGAPVDLSIELRTRLDHAPTIRAPFRHLNLLLQRSGAPGSPTVLNDCFGGVGFHVSRFSHAIDTSARELTEDIEHKAAERNVSLVEITGGSVFSNLNLHQPVLSRRLRVPGDPLRPAPNDVYLEDLELKWDEKRQCVTLNNRSSGDLVHPEYSGYLVSAATPRLHQSLSLLTPGGNLSHKPADLLKEVPESGRIIVRPRMVLGGMVVVRAAVLMRASDLPLADPLTSDGFLAWSRFWAVHGVPARAYLRVLEGGSGSRAKPFYFDASLALCVANLRSQLRLADAEAVVEITELLPDPEESAGVLDSTQRVTEAMVGISLSEEEEG